MNFRAFTCFLLLWTAKPCLAQPGGGGGILIGNLIDKYQAVISVHDPALKIRTFFLCDTVGPSIKEYGKEERAIFYHYSGRSPDLLYIPPYIYDHADQKVQIPNQFVQFIYRGDTTCFEFRDIPHESGSGLAYQMEALQLMPGNFRYYCDPYKRYDYPGQFTPPEAWKTMDEAMKLRSQGLTRATFPAFQAFSLADHLAGKLRPVVYAKPGNRFDTAWLLHPPVYRMDINRIETEKNVLEMRIDDFPLVENGTSLYRLLLPSSSDAGLYGYRETREQQKTRAFFAALAEKELLINGAAYTGLLKVFYPFPIPGPGIGRYTGFHLKIYTFGNGRLTGMQDLWDVDPDSEERVIRPT